MKRHWAMTIGALVVAVAATAAEVPVDYQIAVELDPVSHRLEGSEKIRWTNTGGAPTDELWFHLYLNAFANDRTTFMRGTIGRTLRGGAPVDDPWGWTKIVSLGLDDGVDLLPSLSFERPDDGNLDDLTVARVQLPRPVEPGTSVTVNLGFEALLPRVIARSGWSGRFHLVGQWFPKLGVFEAAGHGGRTTPGWNCHQYHPNSEFYADFADYRVEITVPDGYLVSASGLQVEDREAAEGTSRKRVLTFTAERIHDFAWCAAPGAEMTAIDAEFDPGRDVPIPWIERAADRLGMSPADLELPPVHLRLMVPTSQIAQSGRILRGARLAIAWFGLFYGPYPYPQLTVVSPPVNALEAGGMEYQTFITTFTSAVVGFPPLSWTDVTESTTIHEFGHQYFQGLLASNEFEQAWLDEGLTSFATTSCMQAIDDDGLLPDIRRFENWAGERVSWKFAGHPLRIDRWAWEFSSGHDYGLASYTKTSLTLKNLEGLVGAGAFARAMRRYALEWRWRHPTGADFERVMSDEVGQDLRWYFDQAVHGEAEVDWAVRRVVQRRRHSAEGFVWEDGHWTQTRGASETTDEGEGDGEWHIEADIARIGEFKGPVDVLFSFADGSSERRRWDGRDRWARFEFDRGERLGGVIVDPDGVWVLERRRANNYWRFRPNRRAVGERMWWAEAISNLASLAVGLWS